MSLDAFAFCTSAEPIAREELIRAGRERRWVLHAVRDLFEPEKFETCVGGTLKSDDYWYGWHEDDACSSEYAAALAARQVKQLEHWAQQDFDRGLGAAFVHFEPYSFEADADGAEELEETMGPEYVAAVRAATVQYQTDCHSSDAFYILLVRLIHQLRGGIWVDPVQGEWGADPNVGWGEWEQPPAPGDGRGEGTQPAERQGRRWWEFWKPV